MTEYVDLDRQKHIPVYVVLNLWVPLANIRPQPTRNRKRRLQKCTQTIQNFNPKYLAFWQKKKKSFIKMEIFKNKTAVSASNWHIFLKKSTKSILPNSRSLTNIYKVSLIFM